MNAHTPPTPNPRPQGAQQLGTAPPTIDTVAGEPPVPITVWRTARRSNDIDGRVSARLAYRLVAAYSRPGDTIVDLTDGHVLAAACHAGRRRHHRGWFTDTLSVGPATTAPEPGADPDDEPDADTEAAVWFGDELTYPIHGDGPSAAGPAEPEGSADPAAGDSAPPRAGTNLLVAMWPLDATDTANRVRLAWLLDACSRLLASDGCLILIAGTTGTGDTPSPPEDFQPVTAAAANVGLGYLQHIVAVDADAGTDAFIYYVTDEELLGLSAAGRLSTVAHLRVQADLLVFTPTTLARPSTGRRGGGERRG